MKHSSALKAIIAAVFVLALVSSHAKASDWWYDNAVAQWYEMASDYNTANYYHSIGDTDKWVFYTGAVIGDVNNIEWYAGFACDSPSNAEQVNECNYIWYTLYINALPYGDWANQALWG